MSESPVSGVQARGSRSPRLLRAFFSISFRCSCPPPPHPCAPAPRRRLRPPRRKLPSASAGAPPGADSTAARRPRLTLFLGPLLLLPHLPLAGRPGLLLLQAAASTPTSHAAPPWAPPRFSSSSASLCLRACISYKALALSAPPRPSVPSAPSPARPSSVGLGAKALNAENPEKPLSLEDHLDVSSCRVKNHAARLCQGLETRTLVLRYCLVQLKVFPLPSLLYASHKSYT